MLFETCMTVFLLLKTDILKNIGEQFLFPLTSIVFIAYKMEVNRNQHPSK